MCADVPPHVRICTDSRLGVAKETLMREEHVGARLHAQAAALWKSSTTFIEGHVPQTRHSEEVQREHLTEDKTFGETGIPGR